MQFSTLVSLLLLGFDVIHMQQRENCRIVDHQLNCSKSSVENHRQRIRRIASEHWQRKKVRVVTIERRPFVTIDKEKGQYSGVCFELFYSIQKKYNFSRVIFLPPDGAWGAVLPNGSWTGMVGLVSDNNADMGVAGFSVTYERAQAVEFTNSFHQEPSAILIPPPNEGEKLSVLIRPLSPRVWALLFISIITFAPSLFLLQKASLWIRHDPRYRQKGVFEGSLELMHIIIGSLGQESVNFPVSSSWTVGSLVIMWWMMSMILSNIYVGYLVSYLSVPKLTNPVDSLEDLSAQRKIHWTFRKSSALDSLFRSKTSTGVYKLIGDQVMESDLVGTDYEGANKALTGKVAFIKEKSFLDVVLGEDFEATKTCRVTLAKQMFFRAETSLIAQKKSTLLPLFNDGISWSVSTGLMEKWKQLHWPRNLWCENAASYISNTQPKTRKLTLEDIPGTFLLWAVGIGLSVVAFVSEKLMNCNCRRRTVILIITN